MGNPYSCSDNFFWIFELKVIFVDMAEAENGSLEVDKDQVGTNFFDSDCWKMCLKLKTFMLSLWMMCDVVLDVRSCVGFYKQMQNETKNDTELLKNDTVDKEEEEPISVGYFVACLV